MRTARPASSVGGASAPLAVGSTEAESFPVVGIGASAGGLEAFRQFFASQPADSGIAFILIQHLDPTHESMMVELLASHTAMPVLLAADRMPVEPNHVYVIPPGCYLSIQSGALRLSAPEERHGARMPFDFLLRSMAMELGEHAICVVLSGTGTDGGIGLKALSEAGGMAIAQDPTEAAFDGMPRNAIATGAVDLVLPVRKIPAAILEFVGRRTRHRGGVSPRSEAGEWLLEIIELLRSRTAYDFTPYKHGTLERRIERRRAMAAIDTEDMQRYIDLLREDPAELEQLASDLLINVTSFFRDAEAFEFLERKILPEMVASHPSDRPMRFWCVGCSTGEETYSLAILLREAIATANRRIKLQIFASDLDADAIAKARHGVYPEAIAAEVSPARLARHFTREGAEYRISPELREMVVFTVHDALNDPPFSRLDFVSCRNVLIYLAPAAQAKMSALFHFALQPGGVLFLGGAEALAADDKHFRIVSKSARLYTHIGSARPGELESILDGDSGEPSASRPISMRPAPGPKAIADFCRDQLLASFAPAAVLINARRELLYAHGAAHQHLRIPTGAPTLDVLAMARDVSTQMRLRSAIDSALQTGRESVSPASRAAASDTQALPFRIVVRPVENAGEPLLLVAFIGEPTSGKRRPHATVAPEDASRVAALEQDLAATEAELQAALRDLELSGAQQRAINQEALSINEEFQSTNEELLTSKEELQSVNEELVALNGQLQETLDLQRTTSDDLQNVLYSTDIATFFLDRQLKIRFFTPAARAIFNVISSDLGRPLADLRSLADDRGMLDDARSVLETLEAAEREIQVESGDWFLRRIVPYRTNGRVVEGVVITFANVNERRRAAAALAEAKEHAERANVAKSRFLAAASHDLRQPLQTIALIHGLLERMARTDEEQALLAQLDQTLAAMCSMLNTLLDINQLDTGAVEVRMEALQINDLLERMRGEFAYLAEAQGLELRVVPCSRTIRSDGRLLEQMLRNLLSNALKYTRRGAVLLGCRRRGGGLSVEVWDTGAGIPESELQAIFGEYNQVDNEERGKGAGLGLGLSIVARLAELLKHRILVRSRQGKGSMFAIEIDGPATREPPDVGRPAPDVTADVPAGGRRAGSILIVEDDPTIRRLLEQLLTSEGHRVRSAEDAVSALAIVAAGKFRPDVVLADYNLPNDRNGLALASDLREALMRPTPVILLTGDISTEALQAIARFDCVHLSKPLKTDALSRLLQRLLPGEREQSTGRSDAQREQSVRVYVVDDDKDVRETLRRVLEDVGYDVETFAAGEALLEAWPAGGEICLLVDANLPGMSGLDLLERLGRVGRPPPAIMITAYGDVTMAVRAMKAGAVDFIEKPCSRADVLAGVKRAFDIARDSAELADWQAEAARRLARLTARQREVLDMILVGALNKNIAADLGISQRTVENHRAAIMERTGAPSLPALVRLAVAAAASGSAPADADRT